MSSGQLVHELNTAELMVKSLPSRVSLREPMTFTVRRDTEAHDVRTWTAPDASLDLVLVAYLHLPQDETRPLFVRAVDWLRPGGRLLVLGHDVENLTAGVGGPPDPEILHSVERLAPVAALLDVDRLEQVERETPAGTALDTLLWGRRPL